MTNKNDEFNKVWQDIHNKVLDSSINKDEFREGEFDSFSVVKNRRDFLKIMGFSFTMLPMASCTKGIVRKAVPYLEKSDLVTPGVANWYATTYDGIPLLLKTREGRPIKIEGNNLSDWTKGGANAIAHASLLSLYDSYRVKVPTKDSNTITWSKLIDDLKAACLKAKLENKRVVLVTEEMRSPSTVSLINDFKKQFGNVDHIVYSSKLDQVEELSFGENSMVMHDFSKTNYVLSLGADFLGSHKNSVHNSRQYADRRDVDKAQADFKHVQVENLLSLTGSNADERYSLSFDEIKILTLLIYSKITGDKVSVQSDSNLISIANKIVDDLNRNNKRSFIINGFADLDLQRIVNQINFKLGAFDEAVDVSHSDFVKNGTHDKFYDLVESLSKKKTDVEVIIMVKVNPFYDYFDNEKLVEAFGRIPEKFCFTFAENETSQNCQYVGPLSHQFESWDDTIISKNEISVTQPVIVNLSDTKQFQDVLLKVIDQEVTFDQYMKNIWEKNFWKDKVLFSNFLGFWSDSVQKGILKVTTTNQKISLNNTNVNNEIARLVQSISHDELLELQLYEKTAMRNGELANNPWLQELPDPITKVTWDNYLTISPAYAKKENISTGDMVEINQGKISVVVPALVQPGQDKNTLGLAVGYGRTVCGKVGANLGKNAFPFMSYANLIFKNSLKGIKLKKTGKKYDLALTQTHHSIEGRDLFRETTLKKYKSNPKSGNEHKAHVVTMWSEHENKDHQWAMAIDLNKCNGCSSCIVSCNAENNVPVVGKEEVLNRREMHWLRIDRYYKGNEENPTVLHQPMTCHHCENAPCESVCPVLATVHSSDGLNQQVYNRCVGTRYCANNCPYKVRRFNWFDYPHNDPNEKMVLNPDVSVRSRGVMEKCSMCIQRIQEAKLVAKKEGRTLKDGEIKLACQQSCSSDAIVFGDLKDPESKIAKMVKDPRNFTVLEELNVKPRLSYLTKIRNKD